MLTLIIISAIGWLVSLGMSIYGMRTSWREIDKKGFNESLMLLLLSIPAGWFIGWIMLGFYIKINWIDSHFD